MRWGSGFFQVPQPRRVPRRGIFASPKAHIQGWNRKFFYVPETIYEGRDSFIFSTYSSYIPRKVIVYISQIFLHVFHIFLHISHLFLHISHIFLTYSFIFPTYFFIIFLTYSSYVPLKVIVYIFLTYSFISSTYFFMGSCNRPPAGNFSRIF